MVKLFHKYLPDEIENLFVEAQQQYDKLTMINLQCLFQIQTKKHSTQGGRCDSVWFVFMSYPKQAGWKGKTCN